VELNKKTENMKTKVTGKEIIALGYRQGKWMKDAIVYINENELEG